MPSITPKLLLRHTISRVFYHLLFPVITSRAKILILMYHRVLNSQDVAGIQPGMYVTTDTFEKHVKFLMSHFRIIPIRELLWRLNHAYFERDAKYCVITFDDGWRDNFINAYPILKKYDVPATIFLPTSYIGTTNWFWPEKLSFLLSNIELVELSEQTRRELHSLMEEYDISIGWSQGSHALLPKPRSLPPAILDAIIENLKTKSESQIESLIRRLQEIIGIDFPQERLMLSWEEIGEMSKHGISFGSHTCNHLILTRLSREEISCETRESRDTLAKLRINFIPILAYPNGNYNETVVEEAKKTGYEAAVTTEFGFNDENTNPYELSRISIHNDIASTVPMFACHISGIFHTLRKK